MPLKYEIRGSDVALPPKYEIRGKQPIGPAGKCCIAIGYGGAAKPPETGNTGPLWANGNGLAPAAAAAAAAVGIPVITGKWRITLTAATTAGPLGEY